MLLFVVLLGLFNFALAANSTSPDVISADLTANLQTLSSVIQSANATLKAMQNVQVNLEVASKKALAEAQLNVQKKIVLLQKKTALSQKNSTKSIIERCIKEESPLDVLRELISNEVRACLTVALQENVNIISSTLVEAQAFMDLPHQVASDLQNCGSSHQCLLKISSHAVQESLEVPSKVLVLAARVQQLAYRSLAAINGCALEGLVRVTEEGLELIDDIIRCVQGASA